MRFPVSQPCETGRLPVGDGHVLHWEQHGNPRGRPALALHGGPGSGAGPWMTTLFDPGAHRLVLHDQRGCGRSTPHAGEPGVDLSTNTTWHLVADVERLREHLGIDRWLVYGGSWGSTLALAYAQTHPERVEQLVLGPVTLTRHADVEWLSRGAGAFLPRQWEALRDHLPPQERDGDLTAAYARLLADPATAEAAARAWCEWEEALVAHESGGRRNPRYDDPRFRLGFARLVTHYFSHAAWLADGELLAGAAALRGIPGVLVHGTLDLAGPLEAAWRLHRAWPGSELVVVDTAGHTSAGIGDAVAAAITRFAAGGGPP
ncbi:proline iminopeptidase [Kineococcus xinjiangensis]|uniref:Proline iminopeptidase n=1 Tax=Kineococcus xinjiangensis TaxID=512762 RepID=A0A2S6IVD5_9ACTN|nr:prolyl aminopeptidase [Kineococcus xinjiangensis]PPK98168.1 proline iminopeptidase [Kineococcus xinjiangensis]